MKLSDLIFRKNEPVSAHYSARTAGHLTAGVILFLLLNFAASIDASTKQTPREHPFLICTREQFPELRKRASEEPWRTMKENALERAAGGIESFDGGRGPIRLQRYLGACALAYIVDPDRKTKHAHRVYEKITNELADVVFDESQRWSGVVPSSAAAFVAIIALDIVQEDLPQPKIAACESVIDRQLGKINEKGAWELARLGAKGTWAVYNGTRTKPDDRYYKHYVTQMTEDGVSTVATTYAWARLVSSDSRPQKTGYADVLEFTGIDERYYDDPRLERFYRWLYGSSVTPARQFHAFGDFIPDRYSAGSTEPAFGNPALAYRVGRFDPLAARYMAWALEGREPPGHVLAYVLKRKDYKPKVPSSRLYPDGGAFLREPEDSPSSLAAALYNITVHPDWHMNQEINALSLSAYGARLLMNGGWLGPPTRPAKRNNTLTIDGKEHASRTGAGLEEGLISHGLDYGAGLSGDALPADASFIRSLFLVYAQDGVGGYFLTVDEVRSGKGETIHHYLHPSTETKPKVRVAKAEYDAKTELFNRAKTNRLAIFYGSSPGHVHRELSPSGSARADKKEHYRLEAVFPTERDGTSELITALYPYNRGHPKPELSRLSGDGATGVRLSHRSGPRDYVYATEGDKGYEVAHGVAFQGKVALFRREGGSVRFYFVRKGTRFRHRNIGLVSKKRVSLHLRGTKGRIHAEEETSVKFFHPEITNVQLGDESLEVKNKGEGWLKAVIPPGSNQQIRLVTEDPRQR